MTGDVKLAPLGRLVFDLATSPTVNAAWRVGDATAITPADDSAKRAIMASYNVQDANGSTLTAIKNAFTWPQPEGADAKIQGLLMDEYRANFGDPTLQSFPCCVGALWAAGGGG